MQPANVLAGGVRVSLELVGVLGLDEDGACGFYVGIQVLGSRVQG